MKSFKLKIENPCQENWGKMSVNHGGKFCDSCQKNVVDFTTKTSREIANELKDATEKTCGRFTEAQLKEVYSVSSSPRLETNWYKTIAASFLVSFGVKNVEAQDTLVQNQGIHSPLHPHELLIGDTVLVENKMVERELRIKGTLLDAKTGEPIPFQKVFVGDKVAGAISDFDGFFSLQFSSTILKDSIQLVVMNDHEYEQQIYYFNRSNFDLNEGVIDLKIELVPIYTRMIDGMMVIETKTTKKSRRKSKNK